MEKKCCFDTADILIPKKDFEKWAVIACDQYTSEKEYWLDAENIVGDSPSALRLILPEVYLGINDSERIENINALMKNYLEADVFERIENSFVYVERTQADGRVRCGIVGAIDLEAYEYTSPTNAAVRATEQTVLERIPPRVKIRKDAVLELPHVMLLMDDPDNSVLSCLENKTEGLDKLYDFDLMKNGGHIKGFRVNGNTAEAVKNSLAALSDKNNGFLFCVGDGNHSLATAKECYRQNPSKQSRYALVEIVNIHDSALDFEPIYRVAFGADAEKTVEDFISYCGGEYFGADAHKYLCCFKGGEREISVKASCVLAVEVLQKFLDEYINENTDITVDYIHGEASVKKLCDRDNTVGFIFEGMQKSELFPAVNASGSLPRKTFSMGHADDKRFYIEARIIK